MVESKNNNDKSQRLVLHNDEAKKNDESNCEAAQLNDSAKSSALNNKIVFKNNFNNNNNNDNNTTRSSSWCSKSKLNKSTKEVFYILNWIGSYNVKSALSDLIAGITLGLTIIPESIACALLANLPPQYGLYSSFFGQFIYVIFGSVNKCIIGPTSLVALVTVQFTLGKPIEFAIIITFLAGIVELLVGVLQLGFIFDFISMPVIKAFTSATAVLVTESQIKSILGLQFMVSGFTNSISEWTTNIGDSRFPDILMGVGSMVFLILIKLLPRIPFRKEQKKLKSFCKYVALSRNVIVVLIAATITFCMIENTPDNENTFRLSKNVIAGFPNVSLPPFSFGDGSKTYSFVDIIKELNIAILAVPLVSLLTNISVARGLTPKGSVNANRELIALGLCNIFGSTVQSMPTCGAFSRASIGQSSGLKTSIAGVHSGIIVMIAIACLTPYFHYIPESTLAAILICSILALLDLKLPIKLWHQSRHDFITWLCSFVICILCGVEMGLIFGVLITICQLVYYWARPKVEVKLEMSEEHFSYVHIVVANGLYFPCVDYVREKISKSFKLSANELLPIVIDCMHVTGFDYTAGIGILKLINANSDRVFIMYRLPVVYENLMKSLNDDHSIDNLIFCQNEVKLREALMVKVPICCA